MQCGDIPGHLADQLRAALALAFPSRHELRMLVRYECDQHLDAIVPAEVSDTVVIYSLIEQAIAHGWLDRLVIGACRRAPGNDQLNASAKSLGFFDVPFTGHVAHVTSSDLLAPHKFDLTSQVQLIADQILPGQLVGFITFDNDPTFLRNLRQRLKDDLGRELIYCYPTTLQVSEIKQPSRVVLATVLANARGRLPEQDVLFIVGGIRTEAQLASFWAQLQTALETVEMRHALVIVFSCEPEVPPPQYLYRLDPVHFTRADLRLWITKLVNELHWHVDAIDIWLRTVLQCVSRNDELVSLLVYDHLHFASEKLQVIKRFDAWEVELRQWSQYYV